MAKKKEIEISTAKGRALLQWVGKQPLRRVTAFPAQFIEHYGEATTKSDKEPWQDWPKVYPQGGLLFHGDNKEVLAHLITSGFRGKVDLIYIDPPFDSGADYVRQVQLRGSTANTRISGQDYSLGEQIQYTDIWANDQYFQFLFERLILLQQLLKPNGFICVHMNTRRVHYVKAIMDEVFVESNFRNEIIVKRIRKSYTESGGIASLNEGVDYLLFYSNSPEGRFSPPLKHAPKEDRWHSFDAPNIRPNLTYDLFGHMPPPGRCWMKSQNEAKKMIAQGDLRANSSTGLPEYRIEATEYIIRDTLWDDITASAFTTGYPTEKKEEMLQLILEMASEKGALVLDCFIGSGTTAAVAQKAGRRWIGCDINKGAIQTTSKRLIEIIENQKNDGKQAALLESEDSPAQLTFAVYRVNDYDLQMQHNEAAELAAQHVGIQRTSTDTFFDGIHGKKLAKIIPFNHPLTLMDLEEIKRELEARPDEDRSITVVCLGKETAVDAWIDEWNKLRKKGDVPNKIDVIELRTDPKYGKFFIHTPASAKVKFRKSGSNLHVEIQDFISPSIIERLKEQAGLLSPKIDDWRSMVDTVMIDTDYDGKVFNIALADVPESKDDVVQGSYELDLPKSRGTVAVKITDMLGEEVFITREI